MKVAASGRLSCAHLDVSVSVQAKMNDAVIVATVQVRIQTSPQSIHTKKSGFIH